MSGPVQTIPIDYVTFRMDVVLSGALADASAAYERAEDVSLRDLRCLRIAAFEPGVSQTRLAMLSYVEKTLLSKAVTRLVNRGLLRREVDAADARRVRLFVTPAGQAAVDACEPLGRSLEGELLDGISAADLAVFSRCLDRMLANVATMQSRHAPRKAVAE